MALDIIATKLFKEPKEVFKKSIPKYRCNLTLKVRSLTLLIFPKFKDQKKCVIIFHLFVVFLIFPW